MIGARVTIRGAKEFSQALENVSKGAYRKVIRRGLRDARPLR